jgi:hypothetical protein
MAMKRSQEFHAAERRKKIRKYLRQGFTQVEIAEKLGVNVDTVNGDVAYIRKENANYIAGNRGMIKKDIENLLKSLEQISLLDEEAWKIYYGDEYTAPVVVGQDANGNNITEMRQIPVPLKIRLDALEKVRQNNLDRAKLLKLLNPAQITVEKMVYIEKMMPVVINQLVNLTLEYVPENKKMVFLERIKALDIDKTIMQ